MKTVPTTSRFPGHLALLACFLAWCASAPAEGTLPLNVYLQEGFNAPGLPPGWTVATVSGATATWSVVGTGTNPPIPPFEGTGQASFNSYDAQPGDQARLTSRRVDLSSSSDPFVTFHLYHDDEFPSFTDSVYVEVTTGDSITGPWTVAGGYRRPGAIPGWRQETLSLLPFRGSGRVFVGFRGISAYGNNCFLDQVVIADSMFHDLGAVALTSPAGPPGEVPPGRSGSPSSHHMESAQASLLTMAVLPSLPLTLGAVVQNFGTSTESAYQVPWAIDGQIQTAVSPTRPLARGQKDTLGLLWPTPVPGTHSFAAWTALQGDSNRSNDSARLTVVVLDSNTIFAQMFNDTAFPPAGWAVVNRDGGVLAPWFRGSPASVFLPFEGTGFAADNFQRANGTYIDDYLITPPLTGIAPRGRRDSLKFWTRSALNPPPETNYPDSLMILLSTTGPDTSNFHIVLDYFSVPKSGWTLKAYPLSGVIPDSSTLRVAFRYLHYDGGSSGNNSDFVGIDLVQVIRGIQTDVPSRDRLPSVLSLDQNYPNPFNPTTRIGFSVAEPCKATLSLYDVLGRRVATLFEGSTVPGVKYVARWDGSGFASGVYYYALETAPAPGGTTSRVTRQMLLVK